MSDWEEDDSPVDPSDSWASSLQREKNFVDQRSGGGSRGGGRGRRMPMFNSGPAGGREVTTIQVRQQGFFWGGVGGD